VFRTTGTLNQPRWAHTATLLTNGSVLVVGGNDDTGGQTRTAELYDPTTGKWRYTAHSLNVGRFAHAATRLSDGKVLIVGGYVAGNTPIGTVELFDPATETFTQTTPLLTGKGSGGLFAIANNRVVFIQRSATSDVEVFDYGTKQWIAGSAIPPGGAGPSMTMLNDGRIFVCGGSELADVEVYTPSTDSWKVLVSMTQGRGSQTATTLNSGKVFIASGLRSGVGQNFFVPSTEVYDPSAQPNGSTAAGPSIPAPGPGGAGFSSSLMPDGKVLITGGGYTPSYGSAFVPLADGALFDPATNTLLPVGQMSVSRTNHTMTTLPNGLVLIVGGVTDQSGGLTGVSELFGYTGFPTQPGSFATVGTMQLARTGAPAVALPNGNVFISGGTTSQSLPTATAELYDPATKTFRFTKNAMTSPRAGHSASLLPDGRVLIAGGDKGGFDASGLLNTTEIYDPVAETFVPGPPMNSKHSGHAAVRLSDGRIMVISGYAGSVNGSLSQFVTPIAEIYNPQTVSWSMAAPLPSGRTVFAATRLTDGRIFIAGGYWNTEPDGMRSVLIFDPSSNKWQSMGPMLYQRQGGPTAHSLPNGKVLILGGNGVEITASSSELYDPATGRSVAAGGTAIGSGAASSLLLPNGDVLALGGAVQNFNGQVICAVGRNAAQLFSFQTSTWSDMATMVTGRFDFSAALLNSGQVLVAAGIEHTCGTTSSYVPDAELWTGAATTGTLQVTTNLPAATFTISGPATYNGSGTTATYNSAPVGSYTINYGAVPGYTTPPNETQQLSSGGTVRFTGTYQPQTGSMTINSNLPNARFSLSPGIPGFPTGGPYPVTRTIPVNTYTVTFTDIAGYFTPPPQTNPVSIVSNVTFTGSYAILAASPPLLSFSYQQGDLGPSSTLPLAITSKGPTRSFTVTTSTNPPGGIWLFVPPSQQGGTTPATLTINVSKGLVAGLYKGQVTLTPVGSVNLPLVVPVSLTVTAGTGTIYVDSTPSGAGFDLTGPASVSGITPAIFHTMPAGLYKITFKDFPASGYVNPPSQSQELVSGGSILFQATYIHSPLSLVTASSTTYSILIPTLKTIGIPTASQITADLTIQNNWNAWYYVSVLPIGHANKGLPSWFLLGPPNSGGRPRTFKALTFQRGDSVDFFADGTTNHSEILGLYGAEVLYRALVGSGLPQTSADALTDILGSTQPLIALGMAGLKGDVGGALSAINDILASPKILLRLTAAGIPVAKGVPLLKDAVVLFKVLQFIVNEYITATQFPNDNLVITSK
jgi:N-acetylneuraminic acid mutarotase